MKKKTLETCEITPERLTKLISSLRKSIDENSNSAKYIICPKKQKIINRKRYSGKGRPKKKDYKMVDFIKLLKSSIKNSESILNKL